MPILTDGQLNFIADQQGLPSPANNSGPIDWNNIITTGIGSIDDIIRASSGQPPVYPQGYPNSYYPQQRRTNNTLLIAGGAAVLVLIIVLSAKK